MSKEKLLSLKNPLLVLTIGLLSLTAIRLRDPHIPGMFPTCPSVSLTGFYCVGCGSMRSVRDLTDGNLIGAFGHNILLPFALLWLFWWFVSYTADKLGKTIQKPPMGYKFTIGLLLLVVIFAVMRNVPDSILAP